VAIRCALNSFQEQAIAQWRPAVIYVGSDIDDTGTNQGKNVFVGKCACKLADGGGDKITGCPPPFAYVAAKLKRALAP
jgi:hypothetical protein